ncbi:MAG TPA: hypothetical protein VGZ22_03585 [Isosphaeraceae bacterium]|jgi:hypothetical protein|nr:hypothetical protein [Isosphaeraceae bacterium]
MRASRPSIAALMVLVLVTAVGFAALNRASPLWAAVLLSGVTATYTIAIFSAIYARGPRRAFWSGFAAGGWVYLLLQYGPWCETQVGPYTLPTAFLDVLYPVITHPQVAPTTVIIGLDGRPMGSFAFGSGGTGYGAMGGSSTNRFAPAPPKSPWALWSEEDRGGGWLRTSTPPSFYRVGHCLLSLAAAWLVALIASRLARRNTEAGAQRPVSVSGGQ